MGRARRVDVAGQVYHVLNRAVGRRVIFRTDKDFIAFEAVLAQALERVNGQVELLAYCVMGNHWHLVVRTRAHGALRRFTQWLTLTHTQRYRVAHHSVGHGPVYQGRYKSFIVASERYFLTVCRYVERNAVRAGLVRQAQAWRWSSLWRWVYGDATAKAMLSAWPLPKQSLPSQVGDLHRPRNWLRTINTPLSATELEAVRCSANRGQPYGSQAWQRRIIARHGLESTLRSPGRPKKSVSV